MEVYRERTQEAQRHEHREEEQQANMQQRQLARQLAQEAQAEQSFRHSEREYRTFMNNLGVQPLPEGIPVAAQEQVQGERLSYKKRKKMQKEYKKLGKEGRLLDTEEVKRLPIFANQQARKKWGESVPKHSKISVNDTMRQVNQGNFSNFENLDDVMRNLVASQALRKMVHDLHPDFGSDPAVLCEQMKRNGGVEALLNPALRLGLSLAVRTDGVPQEQKDFFRGLDEAMSTAVMTATLTTRANENVVDEMVRAKHGNWTDDQVRAERGRMIEANEAQQIQIAKRMLLMQLSHFTVKMPEGSRDWDKPVAVAVSHCSRVAFTMPHVERQANSANSQVEQTRMWNIIFNQQNGQDGYVNRAQDNRRLSSTHTIWRRSVKSGAGESKEKKRWFNFFGQRGMNCAIGGLGNAGISGQRLSNDGSCGHFYSMYKEGSTSQYGAMLMGLESDAAYTTNQMGHTHDIHATAEKASSLGGQRTDEVGEKYSGRQCDLTHMTAADISAWMEGLERSMRTWQATDEGMGGAEAIRAMKLLTGKRITQANDIIWLRQQFGIGENVGGLRA